jgi:tetratricopeptide (TPR) repeat protein
MMRSDMINQYPNISLLPNVDDALHQKKKSLPTLQDEADEGPSHTAFERVEDTAPMRFDAPDSLRESLELAPSSSLGTGNDSGLVVLETVRKRQAQEAIETQDILLDFQKTMNMLGVVPQHQYDADVYLNVVRQESTLPQPDSSLMKRLLLKVAKRLDDQVTQALGEDSTVVSDWLDALFLQPVEWKPAPIKQPASTNILGQGDKGNTPAKPVGISTPTPPEFPDRLKHLYVRDALTHLKQLAKEQSWVKADGLIQQTLQYIRNEESLRAYVPQWERLQLQNLIKQSKSTETIQAYTNSSLVKHPSLDVAVWVGQAYAEQGQFAEALKQVHPVVVRESTGNATSKTTLNTAWLQLREWAFALQNPTLERRMAQSLFHFLKQTPELKFNPENLTALERLGTLLELEGKPTEALNVARYRVELANKNNAPTQYVTALKDVVALFARQGKLQEARKAFSLIESVVQKTGATYQQPQKITNSFVNQRALSNR